MSRLSNQLQVVDLLNPADRNIFSCGHLVPHKVLKYHANFPIKIFQTVLAQIDSIQQNLSFRRVVKASQQLNDSSFAFAVFADQRYSLPRTQMKIQSIQN